MLHAGKEVAQREALAVSNGQAMPEPGALIGKLALGDGEGLRPGVGKTVAKIEKALGFLENRLGEMKAGEKTVSRKMPESSSAVV